MRKHLCALLSLVFTLSYSQEPYIMLGRATDKSVTVSILSAKNNTFFIRYGTQSGTLTSSTNVTTAPATVPSRVELSGLKPDTRYFYTLNYKLDNAAAYAISQEYSFHTQRAPGSSFIVVIEADEHLYDKKGIKSLYEITLANQAKDNPDLMFSLGDTFGDDHTPDLTTSEDMKQLHLDYIPLLSRICHSIPFYFCLGNHEGENGYYLKQNNGENICVYGTEWRKYYYPNPYPDGFYTGNMKEEGFGIGLPENYYAFVWGDVHFIVLDVYRECDESEKPQKWNWTLGETQYRWFKSTLENSTSRFKFVMAHHTRGQGRGGINTARAYEWGGYNGDNGTKYEFDTYRPGWGLPIHQLMVKHGVNIYFQGHDHLFAKEDLDGIVYQEVPMPSDTTYEIGVLANADAYSGVTLDGSGHIRLSVTPDCVTVDYVRSYLPKDTLSGQHKNREIAYTYSVGNCSTSIYDQGHDSEKLEVFPNPADMMLSVRYLGDRESAAMTELSDLTGKIIARNQVTKNNEMTYIDTGHLSGGIYVLRYRHSGGILSKKIVVHH